MPSKRKVAKKMKRAIKRAKVRGQSQAQNKTQVNPQEEMMMKLMAMMRSGNGGQGSMDPGAFLAAASRRAHDDAEHAKQMREARTTERNAKDQGRRAKHEADEEEAKHKARVAGEKAEHDMKMAEIGLEVVGAKGEAAENMAKADKMKRKVEEAGAKQELEAMKRKFNDAGETMENLKTYADWTHVPPKLKEMMNAHVNTLLEFGEKISQLGSKITNIDQANVILEELDKMAKKLQREEGRLLEDIAKVEFEKDQVEDQINTKQSIVKKHRELQRQFNEKEQEVKLMKERVKNAGFIFDTDENGEVIETQNDHLKEPEIEPSNDDNVKFHKNALDDIEHHLNYRVKGQGKDGIDWKKVLKINPRNIKSEERELWDKAMKKFTTVKAAEDPVIRGINDKNTQGGMQKITLPRLVQIYQEQDKLYGESYEKAQEKYDKAIEHNEKIAKLPKYAAKPVTVEMNAKLESEVDKLNKNIEQMKLKESLKKEMNDKLIRLQHEKKQIEAELHQLEANEAKDADIQKKAKDLKEVEHEIRNLQRDIKKQTEKQTKVEALDAQTESMKFDNQVMQSRLAETEHDKKTREAAEDKAIKAHIEADKQKQLLEAQNMTYKYEQEARQAEFELNKLNSEEIRATDEKIAKTKAKTAYNEHRRQQTEELINAKHIMRNKVIESKAVGMTDAMIDGNMDYNNMVGQISAMAKEVVHQTDQAMKDKEFIDKKSEELYRRFKDDHDLQLAVVKDFEAKGGSINESIYKDPTTFRKSVNNRETIAEVESYFNRVMKPPSAPPPMPPPSMPPPPRSDYPSAPPPAPDPAPRSKGYLSLFEDQPMQRPTYQQPPRVGEPPSAGYLPPRPRTPPTSSNNRWSTEKFFAPMKPKNPPSRYDDPPYIDSSDD